MFTEDDLTEWNKGNFPSRVYSVDYHYKEHGDDVGVSAEHLPGYLHKAHKYKTDVDVLPKKVGTYGGH
ncbi:hypothetical protein [Cytobacillus sp. IB215316]|uniref:hypothetical protein n=1 Tax=Cytobacillus sp. IB215316 TaxID=3097354 RepID=UPI002A163C7E|nr:hypothetical protein [Cytobacillus sp. IB215316]MDX8363227.1 hypothetical protein [Cytobacillus sp. IB215316]